MVIQDLDTLCDAVAPSACIGELRRAGDPGGMAGTAIAVVHARAVDVGKRDLFGRRCGGCRSLRCGSSKRLARYVDRFAAHIHLADWCHPLNDGVDAIFTAFGGPGDQRGHDKRPHAQPGQRDEHDGEGANKVAV